MKPCQRILFLCAIILPSGSARADLLVKSSVTSIVSGQTGGVMNLVTKHKGNWILTEMKMELPKQPGGLEIPKAALEALNSTTLANIETGEHFQIKGGKVEQDENAALKKQMTEKYKERLAKAETGFKATGRNEKVGNFDAEIWEQVTKEGKTTLWVAPALAKHQEALVHASPKHSEAVQKLSQSRLALPGVVVKERSEMDFGKEMTASLPPGTELPKELASMKTVSITEVTSIEEVTFSPEEFPLPVESK